MMRAITVGLVVVGVCQGSACRGQISGDPDTPFEIPVGGYAVTVEDSGSAAVDDSVRKLVSTRPAPFPSGYWPAPMAVAMSHRYSTPEVEAAIKSLESIGPAAFPALVKHLRDDRYSYSIVSAAWLNRDVGDAVVEVLCDGHYMHSGYKFREAPGGSAFYLSFDGYLDARGAAAWAEWAKGRTRLEIQMDFIDWCIAQENERGYIDEVQRKDILEDYERGRRRVRDQYAEPSGPPDASQPIGSG